MYKSERAKNLHIFKKGSILGVKEFSEKNGTENSIQNRSRTLFLKESM